MTTVVIDLRHHKVVTDTRLTYISESKRKITFMSKEIALPFIKSYNVAFDDQYKKKAYRIKRNGFTEIVCMSGIVSEIEKFMNAYLRNKLPRKYLKNSTVNIISYNGREWISRSYTSSSYTSYKENDCGFITTGSGGTFACGALDMLSVKDKNRAIKAVKSSMVYDNYSGGSISVLNFEDLNDIN